MRVEIKLEDENNELYVVIHTPDLTDEVHELVKYIEKRPVNVDLFTGKKDGRVFILQPNDIEVIRVLGRETVLSDNENDTYTIGKSLQDTLSLLGGNFIRISKSSVINIKRISHVYPAYSGMMGVVMKNGCEEYITRKYLGGFKKRLGL